VVVFALGVPGGTTVVPEASEDEEFIGCVPEDGKETVVVGCEMVGDGCCGVACDDGGGCDDIEEEANSNNNCRKWV